MGSLQPGLATDSARPPTRLPFAPYPFSSLAATAVDTPLARLFYRQGARTTQDSPPGALYRMVDSPDSRCRTSCFEQLQWELSPEPQEPHTTAGDMGGEAGLGRLGRDGDAGSSLGSSMRLPAGSLPLGLHSVSGEEGRIGRLRRGSSGLSDWDLSMTTSGVSHTSSRPTSMLPLPPVAVAVAGSVGGGEHINDSLQSLDRFTDSYGQVDGTARWYEHTPPVPPSATSAQQGSRSEGGRSSGAQHPQDIEIEGGSDSIGGSGADLSQHEGMRYRGPGRARHLGSATWRQRGRPGVGSAEAEIKIMLQVAEGLDPSNQDGKKVEEQIPEWPSSR